MITINSHNIFAENDIYYPDQFRAIGEKLDFKLPATSLLERRFPEDSGFIEPLDRCLKKICESLPAEAMLIGFCAQNMFYPDSVITRGKGLWKCNDTLSQVRRTAMEASQERVIRSDGKVRFYGLCKVELARSLWILEAIRSLKSCFAVIDDTVDVKDPQVADSYYQAAFSDSRDMTVQWPALLQSLARSKSKLVRVTGTHDDREVSLDVFNWFGT